MSYRIAIAFALLLSADADLPRLTSLRSADTTAPENFPSGANLPLFPSLFSRNGPDDQTNAANIANRGTTLQETSKLALIRYVSGEFAKARKPLPGGKDGFTLFADKPLDQQFLDRAVAMHGARRQYRRQRANHKIGISRAHHHRRREWWWASQEKLEDVYRIWNGGHGRAKPAYGHTNQR